MQSCLEWPRKSAILPLLIPFLNLVQINELDI